MENTNRLIHAQSPYLQQHASNPVDWYEWGNEALEKAKTENKPIIISIGYAACHWCHVMAHKCFDDYAIAALMNEYFVCIKVDREERPDIDQVYMEAAQMLTGSGGWPLNAIALPDGRPFFAGTYFPPAQWTSVLEQIAHLYANDYSKILHAAESLTQAINRDLQHSSKDDAEFDMEDYHKAYQNHVQNVDFVEGGYKKAPKFMLPVGLSFFLQYNYFTQNNEALKALTVSLDKMAAGGIYDHLAGGFARYSTDEKWLVPHFEKMLYDNAQLISLYAKAFQLTASPVYANVVKQSIAFCENELSSGEPYFFSAIDADSEHEEGKFYVWTKREIESLLSPEMHAPFCSCYNITDKGNWEDEKNILHNTKSLDKVAFAFDMEVDALHDLLARAKQVLFAQRALRVRPTTDDKTICAWNALMASAYCDAYRALGDEKYREKALQMIAFMQQNMRTESGGLWRIYKDGRSSIDAFLDDYAFFAKALIDVYEISFDDKLIDEARKICDYVLLHFFNDNSALLYYTSNLSEQLIARKTESTDNVIPSSNATMAHVFYKLSQYCADDLLGSKAHKMLGCMRNETQMYGAHFALWAELLGLIVNDSVQVVISGPEHDITRKSMQQKYAPNEIYAGGISSTLALCQNRMGGNKTKLYRCVNNVCEMPVIVSG